MERGGRLTLNGPMLARSWLFVGVLLGVLSIAAPAFADRATAAEAQRAYQRGLKHYNLSQWQAALEAFQAAYLAKPDPALLFNIGQCQRQLADYRNAANSFRAFLREQPNIAATQQTQVEGLLLQMEQAQQEARASQPPQGLVAPPSAEPGPSSESAATVGEAPTATTTATTSPVVKRPLYKKWWLWTAVGGVLVVGVGVGVGVGLAASRVHYPDAPGAAATVVF